MQSVGQLIPAGALVTVPVPFPLLVTVSRCGPDTFATVAAQDATPEAMNDENTSYLFLQSFQSGSIVAKDGEADTFTLTLEQGLGQTIYFSDRPERIVGAVTIVPAGPKSAHLDVVFEAAWADSSVQHAADVVRPGGRLVLVGIPGDDRLTLSHGTARRKGLTIRMARRMKATDLVAALARETEAAIERMQRSSNDSK